jgi:hypothetical protein
MYFLCILVGISIEELNQALVELKKELNQAQVELKEELNQALVEQDKRRTSEGKERTIVASHANQLQTKSLLDRLRVSLVNDTPTSVIPSPTVHVPFDWQNMRENDACPRARIYIEEELRKEGVILGRSGYEVHDVHSKSTMLNFEDEKVGKLSGGTDIAIAPYDTAASFVSSQCCALFELKPEYGGDLANHENQAIVEFVAARCLSRQPDILVALTNLSTAAIVYQSSYNPGSQTFYIRRSELSIDALFQHVAIFLKVSSIPDATFFPEDSHNDPREAAVLAFKKTRLTDFFTTTAWEQFSQFADEVPDWSAERAGMVSDLLRSCGVEKEPAVLRYAQMYS